jgi:hypothetical protein
VAAKDLSLETRPSTIFLEHPSRVVSLQTAQRCSGRRGMMLLK